MPVMAWPFIQIGDDGIATLGGTRTKVIEIALDQIAHHWDADEIHRQYPYLSLAQIHAALGYYYDNQGECDQQIEIRRRVVDLIRIETENAFLQQRLQKLTQQ